MQIFIIFLLKWIFNIKKNLHWHCNDTAVSNVGGGTKAISIIYEIVVKRFVYLLHRKIAFLIFYCAEEHKRWQNQKKQLGKFFFYNLERLICVRFWGNFQIFSYGGGCGKRAISRSQCGSLFSIKWIEKEAMGSNKIIAEVYWIFYSLRMP